MLPIFLMMAAFVGGMSTAIDVTAGERERGSLESLLLFPVSRVALAGGKWMAAVVVNLLVVVATLVVSVAVLRSPKLDGLGFRFADDFGSLALWLAILLPLTLLGPALQMAVALFSRSFKEAQTYLSLLVMAPALPGLVFAFRSVEIESWMRWTPIVGQQIALEDALRGEALAWASHLGLLAVTCLLAFACVALVSRLLDHEKLVVLA